MKESERNAQIEIGGEEERREGPYAGIVTELTGLFLMPERHWKLINIVAKLGNMCLGRKSCVRETKIFLT